jgi:DNA invertase Pin-like site-specific DNA recombinase
MFSSLRRINGRYLCFLSEVNLCRCQSFDDVHDLVVCHSMDRLARNLDDLRRVVTALTKRGIKVQFVKESLTFTGEDSPMATLLLNVMGSFAQFERELIKERQREGIAIAKKKGVYKGRKPSLEYRASCRTSQARCSGGEESRGRP